LVVAAWTLSMTSVRAQDQAIDQPPAAPDIEATGVGDPIGALIAAQTGPVAVAIDPFLFEGVAIDASGPNTVAARESGLVQARVAAFQRLVARMVPAEHAPALLALPRDEIIDLVQEFSVANERSSAVRYLADVNVRFNPIAIRALFGQRQVPFAEIPSQPLVIVPLSRFEASGQPVLWGDPDPWLAAWTRLPPRDGLVPVIVPFGDIVDLGALSAEQVLAADVDAFRRYAELRGTAGVVVASIAASEQPGSVDLTLTEYRNAGARFEAVVGAFVVDQAAPDAALAAAVDAAAREIEQQWKRRTILDVGVGGEFAAIADITELQDWLRLRAKIRDVPIVRQVKLQAITRNRVQVSIAHAGTVEQMQAAMAIQGIGLTDEGGLWVLTLAKPSTVRQSPNPVADVPETEADAVNFSGPAP
jgi:hypothetical protein